ncbi:MAG TPA: chromate transporter [Xanthobacteraceae bacterium]|nr:chromate transporter [Xanthobacteraceae bacterium]
MKGEDLVLALAWHFLLMSLLAVGGVYAVLPEIHRQVIETRHWMTEQQFADLFAIAQAAPGPNMLFATLIGWHVAGFAGALVTSAALCGPTCVLTYGAAHVWQRFKDAPWRIAIQAGLVPVAVGLVAASAYLITRAADHSVMAVLLTALTAGIAYGTRINPLWALAAAAAIGFAGYV